MARDTGDRDRGGWPRWLTAQRLLALVLVALVAGFILQNREEVTLRVLLFTVSAPLWSASLSLLVVGILIGWLLTGRGKGKSRD